MGYDLNPISLEALLSLQEVATAARADTAAIIANFRSQRQTARLQEYCSEISAKIHVLPDNRVTTASDESEPLVELATPLDTAASVS